MQHIHSRLYSRVLAASLGLLLTGAAHSADQSGNYAIWGVGSHSCFKFSKSNVAEDTAKTYRDYLMGYLTAYNAVASDTYSALGGYTLSEAMGWLGEYCDTNKMDSFDRAVKQMIVMRHAARKQAANGSQGWGRAVAPATNDLPDAPTATQPQ